jgi:hypothetical protein
MFADEIRKTVWGGVGAPEEATAEVLIEIAAQLAELNGRFESLLSTLDEFFDAIPARSTATTKEKQ